MSGKVTSRKKQQASLRLMIQSLPQSVRADMLVDKNGYTLLHRACMRG